MNRAYLLLAVILASCAQPYQPETKAILEANPTAATWAKINDIDAAVRATKALDEAGMSSGYWDCLGGYVFPYLNQARAAGVTVFDRPGLAEIVTEAQQTCEPQYPAFDSALDQTTAHYRLTNNLDKPNTDGIVREFWVKEIQRVLNSKKAT